MPSPATKASAPPQLRPMQASDMESCQRLTQALKWPHRLEDWQFVQALGDGFVIEQHDAEAGTGVAGSGLVWHYGTTHAALGLVIVANSLQGMGLGRQLMQQLLVAAGPRSVLLNATVAGQPLYEKLGFVTTGKLHQHQGTLLQTAPVALAADLNMRPLRSDDLPQLLALDLRASGMDRSAAINALNEVSEGIVIESADGIIGFALTREFGRGRAIGPIVATSTEHAKAMISHWINTYSASFIRIDVPERSGLSPWLSEIGLTRVDTVVSMCRGELPRTDPQFQLYSLINQALG
jgi:ribosomal protein S18 acetylase RimI-like enzyme